MEVLTAAQMRAIEKDAIEAGSVTGLELMERAGQGVIDAIFAQWPDLVKSDDAESGSSNDAKHVERTAVVLCGPGNNGGDGFVVARLLHRLGWLVEVLFWGDSDRLPPDARSNFDAWSEIGRVAPLTKDAASLGARPTVLIDALLGIGANRALPLEIALAHHAIENRDVSKPHPWLQRYHLVALDCPSGMDSDSGAFLMPEAPSQEHKDDADTQAEWWSWWSEDASKRLLRSDLVVTFHRLKPAHVLGAPLFKVRVVDIGLGRQDTRPGHLLVPREPKSVHLLDADFGATGQYRHIWPGAHVTKRRGHKFRHGHAFVLCGGAGRTGAARLAARGALRIGAGLTTLGVPGSAQLEVASQITALMLARVDDAKALAETLNDDRITALCIGPGLGLARAKELVPVALRSQRPCVLDADALSAFGEDPDVLFGELNEQCVLTPHGGEFSRLFPDIAKKLNSPHVSGPCYSKIDATRDAAARAGCILLYKGVDTVIAHPDGRCSVHAAIGERAVPWLATAGAGDVLAGFITGLLARDVHPLDAAEVATWLHVECARSFGPGLIAEDLPEALPRVLNAMLPR